MNLSREERMAIIGQTCSMLLQKAGEGTGHLVIVYQNADNPEGVSTITTVSMEKMKEMLSVVVEKSPTNAHQCTLDADELLAKAASRE